MKYVIRILLVAVILAVAAILFIPNNMFNSLSAKLSGNSVSPVNSQNEYKFYYSKLNDQEKSAYDSIYNNISNFPGRIVIPKINDSEMENVFQALSYDNPELFYIGNSCRMINVGNLYFFVPDYLINKDTYNNYLSQIQSAEKNIISGLNSSMTDYDKELYIHDYLIKNCEYSNSESNLNYTIYGALINKTASCEGYARTAQFLMNSAGVNCRVITGKAQNESGKVEGHMWNIVTIENKKYHLDITWDDFQINNAKVQLDGNRSPSHMFFNITTENIANTHTDIKMLGEVCNSTDANYYVKSGLLFSTFDDSVKNKIVESIANQVKVNGNSIEIRFDNANAYASASKNLFSGEEIYRLITRSNLLTGKKLSENTINYYLIDDKMIIRIFFNYL